MNRPPRGQAGRSRVDVWRTRLTPDEVERLRSRLGDVSNEFYTDAEWGS